MYFRQAFFAYTKKLTVIKQNIITVHVQWQKKLNSEQNNNN